MGQKCIQFCTDDGVPTLDYIANAVAAAQRLAQLTPYRKAVGSDLGNNKA